MKTATREAVELAKDCVRVLHAALPAAAETYVSELDDIAFDALKAAIQCRRNGASPEVQHHAWTLAAANTLAAHAAASTLAQLRGETS